MAFEIPSARIRELQNDLRRESGFAAYDPEDPSLPPLLSVADAIAALDPPDLPSSLRCGRCGSGGGLLQGPQSTLCVYCGADRGMEGFSHSISFYSTAACRKLLDYLGLDGSEAVLLETEPSISIKGQSSAAPKDELVLSDLLDLKLRWPSDKEEVNNNGTNKVPSGSMYNFNTNGLDIGAFFSGIDKEISSSLSSKSDGQLSMEESSTHAINNASPSSANFAVFENLQSLKSGIDTINDDDRKIGDSFAAWEAEFQPDCSKNLVANPKTLDHSHDFSDSKSAQTPDSGIGFHHLDKKEQEISTESNDGCLLKEPNAPSSINNWVPDEFWSVKPAEKLSTDQLISETNTTNKFGNPMSENSNDDLFSEWQGLAISSGAQENLAAQGVQTEGTLFRHPQETKDTELGTTTNKTELDFDEFVHANNDSCDDWKDFTSSNERQKKLLNLVGKSEVMSSEHPLETKSHNLLPISGKMNFHDPLHLDSNENSFDDWQDFTSSSKGREKLQALQAQSEVTFSVPPLETKLDNLLPTSGKTDFHDSLHPDSNDDSFDDWQDFTSFSKGQERLQDLGAQSEVRFSEHPLQTKSVVVLPSNKMESSNSVDINISDDIFDSWQGFTDCSKTRENMLRSEAQSINTFLDYSSGTKMVDTSSGSKDVDNNESFDYNDDSFNNWQGFTSTSGHNLLNDSTLSGHPLEKKSVEPWPSEPANGHDESLGDRFEFTSSSEARQSLANSGQQTDAEPVAQSSETKLAFSEDMGFGNPDLFYTSGIQNYQADRDGTRINSLASNGVNSVTHRNSAERSSNIFENSKAGAYEESGKSKIEVLMSQIPDISFMLKDELSVPVKLDMSDLKS